MHCKIQWNILSLAEWNGHFDQIARSNVLQSYTYAQAQCKLKRQKARWGLITIDDKPAGLVQILEAGILKNLFHAVILDRGPLWFEGFGGVIHIKLFFEEFDRQFPNRFGRKRRIIPEIQASPTAEAVIKQIGLERFEEQTPYQTLWWGLMQSDEEAREGLRSNWRGSLKKAENSDIRIEWDITGKLMPWMMLHYKIDKMNKGYLGASPQLMDNLAIFSARDNPMVIGKASLKGEDIAGVLFIKHGRSATYQIGWSSDKGRESAAHHLLLWQARNVLQQLGVKELDLGGVNDETAAGVKKFKCGTGADEIELIGQYH